MVAIFQRNPSMLLIAFYEHVQLTFTSVAFGILLSVPLGILLTRYRKAGKIVLAVLGILQTVPSMVMFGIMLPFTGIGKPTAMIVLTLYSILPILRNTYTGISEVPESYVEAAKGMGMNSSQILIQVECPVALPVIVNGIRLSCVYIISWATLAAIIGGGGLGDIIYFGLARVNHSMLLLGAIPATLLVFFTSFVIAQVTKAVTPRGLRRGKL